MSRDTKPDYAFQVMWSPADNAYLASPLELAGCIADGATPEEALANLRVVIAEWIEVAREDGREIPEPMTTQKLNQLQRESQLQLHAQIQQQVQKAMEDFWQQIQQQPGMAHTISARGGMVFNDLADLVPSGKR